MSENQTSVTPRLVEQFVVTDFIDSIICGDNCEIMRRMPDGCIDLVVTSPPYDDLRAYGGHSWDFYGVAWNLKRVLKPGGVIVWIVNDATVNGSETCASFQQAMHFKAIGLNLHDTMIWDKPFIVPRPSNRYESSAEYMFVFSKGKPKTVNLIKDKQNVGAGRRITGHKRGVNGQPEYFHGAATGKEVAEFGARHNVWVIDANRGDNGHDHPATFPDQLAADHITTWTSTGDLVLDPFAGSGTTCLVAKELGRHWAGIEVNPAYVEIINKRMAQEVLCL